MDKGNIDIKVLYDQLIRNVILVYSQCTGGEITDPHAPAEVVIDKIKEFYGDVYTY